MQEKARRVVADLFQAYMEAPAQLPKAIQERIGRDGDKARVICDYIAGMTDRFAIQEHQKLFDPNVHA
jgi:dGTPase